MKVCVLIIFMVIQVILCDKATSKLRRKLIVPKINDKCKKIKCAATEEPECVKLWRPDLGHTFYINVVNKCELEYMKCHDGVEAKIVPMKFCGHGNGVSKANNKNNKTGKAHLRVKRSAKQSTESNANKNETVPSMSKKLVKKDPHKWKHETLNLISKDRDVINDAKKKGGKNVRANDEFGYPYSSDFGSDTEGNERKKIGKGIAGHPLSIETDYDVPLKVVPPSPDLEGKYASTDPSKIIKNRAQFIDPETFPLISMETITNQKVDLAEADVKEQDELCPAVCPTRDVMVCARCQHGIYKTFISVCHMRIFACNHNDEALELISRFPCVLSAPYISEEDMIPKGRVVDETEDDKVLRYIICRDKNQLGSVVQQADPRCVFEKKPVLRGIGIRLPTSSEAKSSSNTLGSTHSSSWSKSSENSSSVISASSGPTSSGLSSSSVGSDSSSSLC